MEHSSAGIARRMPGTTPSGTRIAWPFSGPARCSGSGVADSFCRASC